MSRTRQSVERELEQQRANLDRIEEKIAIYTELEAPIHLLNQRNQIRDRIAQFKEWLRTGQLPDEEAAEIRGKLIAVPDLPPHFLTRPDDLEPLKAAVLADVDRPVVVTGTARKVGVQGMGGIGKSVLAAALARDDEVRHAFPDGVLWVTVGQEPALTRRQSQLAETLGDSPRSFEDVQQGKARLSELLADKACLLILDDVWQAEHAEAFDALGPRCRMLITTRDAGLITALGAAEHRLDVLSDEQARALLAEWAGQAVETLPPEARDVARECGNLPLALAMIGATVRGRPDRWGNALHRLRSADLEKIRRQFPNYPYPDLMRAIQVSVEALASDVQARYLDFAIFPEDTLWILPSSRRIHLSPKLCYRRSGSRKAWMNTTRRMW